MLDCNVILKGYQGAIEITNLENQRLDKCSWIIMAPQGNRVNMTFTSFNVIGSRLETILFNNIPTLKNRPYNSQLTVSTLIF